ERTTTIYMPKFDAFDVERNCPFPLCDLHHFACRNEQELGIRVDESSDQPGTGDAIDLGIFASDPFHNNLPTTASRVSHSHQLMCLAKNVSIRFLQPNMCSSSFPL